MNLDYQEHWTFYGHPVPDASTYGLYEPTNDSFFVVNRNLSVLQEVALLFSSRFTLYVCDISAAASKLSSPIDNTNCANWTVDNKSQFNITRFRNPLTVDTISTLVPSSQEKIWNFAQDQQYLIAVCFWIGEAVTRILDRYNRMNANPGHNLEALNQISKVFGAPFAAPHIGTIEKIKEIIYTEFDYTKAKAQIDQLLIPYYG